MFIIFEMQNFLLGVNLSEAMELITLTLTTALTLSLSIIIYPLVMQLESTTKTMY